MSGVVPSIRFPGYHKPWGESALGDLVKRASHPVNVDPDGKYREIGVRSHGRGIFHKEEITGRSIGEKRVFRVVPDCLILNIVFAWEQAVAITSDAENGFIASHRFPMFRAVPQKADLEFLRQFFLTPRGKRVLEIASPGGAGRNKTLGQSEFLNLKISFPEVAEQSAIAEALGSVDRKISLLRDKRAALERFKAGTMDRIFGRELRLYREDGSDLSGWREFTLSDLLSIRKETSMGGEPVYSVSLAKGLVDQVQHLGRRFASSTTDHYSRVCPGDIVYTKSPTGNFPLGMALLHKSFEGQGSPIPGQSYPTASVTGMPSAVKPLSTVTRTWNSAT